MACGNIPWRKPFNLINTIMATLQAPYIPNQPTSPRDANGIAHSDPKADRAAVKAAWATWVANWKAFNVDGVGVDPGPFDYAGFTYADE